MIRLLTISDQTISQRLEASLVLYTFLDIIDVPDGLVVVKSRLIVDIILFKDNSVLVWLLLCLFLFLGVAVDRNANAQTCQGFQGRVGPTGPMLHSLHVVGEVADLGDFGEHRVDLLLDPLGRGVVVEHLQEGVVGAPHEGGDAVAVVVPVLQHLKQQQTSDLEV